MSCSLDLVGHDLGQRRAALGRLSDGVAPSLVVLAAGLARRYGGCKPLAPIGPSGEAVIDLLVSDAIAAGFGRVVLVLHPETGPAIRYHVDAVLARTGSMWPSPSSDSRSERSTLSWPPGGHWPTTELRRGQCR